MRKLLFYILLLVAFSSCTNGEKATSLTDSQDSTLRIALLPTLDCLPLYYAQTTGIFDTLGLKAQLITYEAAMDADTAFLASSADIIFTDLPKALLWRTQGDSVGVIAQTQLNHFLVTAHVARIKTLKDLKEKIIGITRHSAVDMTADSILAKANYITTDLNKPQINNLRLRCQMVNQNQYDGAILPEPYASECVARGGKRLIGTPDLGLNLSAIVVRDSVYHKHKDKVKLLLNVWNRACKEINSIIAHYDSIRCDSVLTSSDKTQAIQLIQYFPKDLNIDIPDTLVTFTTYNKHTNLDSITFAKTYEWLQSRKLVKNEIKHKEIVYE